MTNLAPLGLSVAQCSDLASGFASQIGDSLEEFLVANTQDAKLRQLMMSMSEAIRTIAFKVQSAPACPQSGPALRSILPIGRWAMRSFSLHWRSPSRPIRSLEHRPSAALRLAVWPGQPAVLSRTPLFAC